MLGVAHFGYEDEEHEVPRVGEDGISDADESGDEICGHGYAEGTRGGGVEACADHADEAGDDDGEDGGDGEPGEAVKSAREGAEEGGDCENARVEHEAEFVGLEGAEGDLSG